MNKAIEIIKDEHRSMAAILKGLLDHYKQAAAGQAAPDYYLMSAMLDYIEAFPERRHHPKEDEFLFRLLRLRTAESHPILDELEAQHDSSKQLLDSLRLELAGFKESGDLSRLGKVLDEYAEFHWAHMRKEEEIVLPLAEKHLTAEDWEEIDTAFQANLSGTW